MKIFKDYSLGIVLFILFLISWISQYVFQWQVFVQDQQQHGQEATMQEFIPEFGSSTMENWQSEYLQLFSMVVLTSFLIHKGSAESRDSNDKMEASLNRIEKKLNNLNTKKK